MKIMASSPITSWEIDGETVETVSDFILGAPVLWPPYAKSWLIGKDFDAGRDWGQEKKGTTGWDGWMASPTQWMWVWVNSGRWWWTGRPGMLRFMGSRRVGHDWATELHWGLKVQAQIRKMDRAIPLSCLKQCHSLLPNPNMPDLTPAYKWVHACLSQPFLWRSTTVWKHRGFSLVSQI